jgi:hypothetical protein
MALWAMDIPPQEFFFTASYRAARWTLTANNLIQLRDQDPIVTSRGGRFTDNLHLAPIRQYRSHRGLVGD